MGILKTRATTHQINMWVTMRLRPRLAGIKATNPNSRSPARALKLALRVSMATAQMQPVGMIHKMAVCVK